MAKLKINNIHFIGIGGVGMSGIAIVAKAQGMNVTGSDLRQGYMTDILEEKGIKVSIGHKSSNIKTGKNAPDVVVVSTAIWGNNPELRIAKERKIKIWHRAEALAYLGRDLKTLAVSGTHGKTTTSSMLASTMEKIGLDPTFLIGGVVRPYGTNAWSGNGEYYVVEADESDKSFTYLNPYCAIVTNIEADHLDHYKDTNEIYEKFEDFLKLVPKDGVIVCCADDEKLCALASKISKRVVTYGFSKNADCVIHDYKVDGFGCKFKLSMKTNKLSNRKKEICLDCKLEKNSGKHYAANASSVIVLLDALNYDLNMVVEALSKFSGTKRRFDFVGCESGVTVMDDYAHHPTEIAATVKSALELDYKNVHVIWQPHRFSRFNMFNDIFYDEFAHAFDGCKTVTFTNVYGAGEVPVPGITGYSFLKIVKSSKAENAPKTYYVSHRLEIVEHIVEIAKEGDLVITMGAGDITSMASQILDALKRR